MSRLSKYLLLTVVVVFLLACNMVTQPIRDAQDLAETAQAATTLIPVETLQALPSVLPTVIPAETLQALPSAAPTFEAIATAFGNSLNPQGTPVQEWKGIPIMPQAIAGQEFSENNSYSFKLNVSAKEVADFYNQQLPSLGWTQPFQVPVEAEGGFLFFQKENTVLTIFVTPSEGSTVVILSLP